ncbi:MAG: hypothetical protein HKP61_03645, partial [Dactylosporangium sp.]|nr:hypothetical protein [Dactylosporangium sp.]NNJ60047.1 hypothetical protein [Dactylosporangium sp.]
MPAKARTRVFTAAYKARVLEEYDRLDKAGKGAYPRREGLYTSLVSAWRQRRDRGARQGLARPAGRAVADSRDGEIRGLQTRVERLEAELAKARDVIGIQGKFSALWGQLAADGAVGGGGPRRDRLGRAGQCAGGRAGRGRGDRGVGAAGRGAGGLPGGAAPGHPLPPAPRLAPAGTPAGPGVP